MKTLSVTLLALAGSLALNASPSLIGSTATINYLFPDSSTVFATSIVPVTSGVEVTCPGGYAGSGVCKAFAEASTIDIGATSITLHENAGTSYNTGAFNGVQFTDLNFGPGYQLTGFTLSTDLAGLVPADVSFTGNSIEYNAEGLSFANAPYTITLNLNATSTTPEPATIGLFGLLSATLGLWKLRSHRRNS